MKRTVTINVHMQLHVQVVDEVICGGCGVNFASNHTEKGGAIVGDKPYCDSCLPGIDTELPIITNDGDDPFNQFVWKTRANFYTFEKVTQAFGNDDNIAEISGGSTTEGDAHTIN